MRLLVQTGRPYVFPSQQVKHYAQVPTDLEVDEQELGVVVLGQCHTHLKSSLQIPAWFWSTGSDIPVLRHNLPSDATPMTGLSDRPTTGNKHVVIAMAAFVSEDTASSHDVCVQSIITLYGNRIMTHMPQYSGECWCRMSRTVAGSRGGDI
jgi:hypothetical protein